MIKLPGTYGQIARQLRGQVVAFDEGHVAGYASRHGAYATRNPWPDAFNMAPGVAGRGGTHKTGPTRAARNRAKLRFGRMQKNYDALPPAVRSFAEGNIGGYHHHGHGHGHHHHHHEPEWKAAGACCEGCHEGNGCESGSVGGGCGGCSSPGGVGCGCGGG
jgi:hypothetical protein